MTRAPGASRFRRIRIALLLVLLLFTAAWGVHTAYHRRARGSWDRPLEVGLVLLSPGGDVDAERWRAGAAALAARIDEEMARWRGPGGEAFHISVVGPVRFAGKLPLAPASGGLLARARHALDVWTTIQEIDRAAGGEAGGFDLRVFFRCALGPENGLGFAEGSGAVNGEVALVNGSCHGDLSLPLQAVGHELFHTVGARDRYDGSGHARDPDGLADPERVPRYPQSHAEWMVGEIPIAPGRGRLPESLREMQVGAATAREIGWIR